MNPTDIEGGIASFPRWHYQFDLQGLLTPTPGHKINRHEQRRRYFFEPLVAYLGGSLAGKRVLDLGCNAGFWSLHAIRAGASFVLGIDGRQTHVEQASFVFGVNEIDPSRYEFVEGNVVEFDFSRSGTFDVVLCLGLLYHVSKPVELLERITPLNSDVLVIDTMVETLPGSVLSLRRESLDDWMHAVDHELVMTPTAPAVRDLVAEFGYSAAMLRPRFTDYTGSADYQSGRRRAFVCLKGREPEAGAFELEEITSPLPRLSDPG